MTDDGFGLPEQTHADDRCFLCGSSFELARRTEEHIFPKWLLHRFRLWDQTITFPVGHETHYRKVRIPCCRTCNTVHLAKVEKKIEEASSRGFDSFRRLRRTTVFLWLAKILYEMMYLDSRWFLDPSNRSLGKILDPEELYRFQMLFTFLQGTRIR